MTARALPATRPGNNPGTALAGVAQPPRWMDHAACAGTKQPDDWFPASAKLADREAALRVCRHCPVTLQCLSWAIATGQQFGIWGGVTEHRLTILRNQARKGTR